MTNFIFGQIGGEGLEFVSRLGVDAGLIGDGVVFYRPTYHVGYVLWPIT